jgi:hypothetical protein
MMKLKKNQLKKDKKITRINKSTCNPSHKIKITPWNAKQNKLKILISNQPNIEGWD